MEYLAHALFEPVGKACLGLEKLVTICEISMQIQKRCIQNRNFEHLLKYVYVVFPCLHDLKKNCICQVNTRKLRSRRNAGRRKRYSGHWAGTVVGAKDTDLVHLSKSPNYCRANDKKGILGTKVNSRSKPNYLICKVKFKYHL